MGKGGICPSLLEMLSSVSVLQMLSKVSVDEIFMHYLKKCRQLLGASPLPPPGLCPWTPWGLFRFSDSLIAHS